jgi:hypothetical protein
MRVRQARPCSASRTDGEPCQGYAMEGQAVCDTHGGLAQKARRRATAAELEAASRALLVDAYARWQQRLAEWKARELVVAARILAVPVSQAHEGHVAWARVQPAWPAEFPPRPELLDCIDKRRLARIERLGGMRGERTVVDPG